MNDRATGQQLPGQQQTGVLMTEEIQNREEGSSPLAAGRISIAVIIILRVKAMANHLMPGIVLSALPGLSYLTLTTALLFRHHYSCSFYRNQSPLFRSNQGALKIKNIQHLICKLTSM